MRNIVAYELLTLDGVAEHPDEFMTRTGWEETDEHLGRLIATQDTVLLGRRTYDEWAQYWPTSDVQPFADFINNVEKFVVTSRPLERQWGGTTVIDSAIDHFVGALKQRRGGDIGVHGSIALAQALLEEDLVDELRLVIAPTVQMRGRRLFERGLPKRLTLIGSEISPSGYLILDYSLPTVRG